MLYDANHQPGEVRRFGNFGLAVEAVAGLAHERLLPPGRRVTGGKTVTGRAQDQRAAGDQGLMNVQCHRLNGAASTLKRRRHTAAYLPSYQIR